MLLLVTACRAPEPPLNLIIVLVDTTRADRLGYHGYVRPTSPRLDALARSSVAFVNHYSHSSRTGPSVASIFTGLHPRSHGVVNPLTHWDAKGTLGPDQTTLAELLTARGYRCSGFVSNVNVSPRFGFAQGFEFYDIFHDPQGRSLKGSTVSLRLNETKSPFFLYLHYMQPHSSYEAPAPYATMFTEESYDRPITGDHIQLDAIVGGKVLPTDADRRHLGALYDQEIRYFDDLLGELLDYFGEAGLLEESILVFIADHGEEIFDHGSVLHGYTLYEEQLRVPLLIRDPRRLEPRRVEAVSRHVDLLPTLLELLGVPPELALQGASLVPLIDGAAEPDEARPVFAQSSLRAVKTI